MTQLKVVPNGTGKVLKKKEIKKNKIVNLLFYGDFSCDTGFGQVSKELINNWAKDKNLKITVFAINDKASKPHSYLDNVFVIPALSTSKEKKDVYCRIEFLNLLYQQNFDVVFCLNDVEIFNDMKADLKEVKLRRQKENKLKQKTILYFPIDSEPRPSDLEVLSFFDEVVTYTEYAKGVISPILTPNQSKRIKVIPHGCNTENFYPFDAEQKKQAKIELFGSEDVFVFGSVNRNSARKDLGTLIIGFALFKHTTGTNSILYLHCNPNDPSGIKIERLCERLGLDFGKDVITPENYCENKGYDISKVNKIYNSFDCFITTTTAEGWGLSISEAMATKTLVACPKHTSITEITNNGENSINFMFQQRQVFVNDLEKIRFISNPSEIADVMKHVVNFKNESDDVRQVLAQKIENAYQKVTSYNWVDISKRFKLIIDNLSK